ncbi:MAG: VWA domain-containing protein, partial [Micrococcales bacterium]|nr:VWA domain-containing protein [Micrococcales bacterium]
MWPWAGVAAAAVVAAAGLVAALVRWRRPPGVVANTGWVRDLPVVRAALRRRTVTAALGWVATFVLVVAMAGLVARPVQVRPTAELMGRRDIVLCLDVSGSMLPYDTEVLESFEKMVASFDGERIALSVFNATSRTIFPLTDDYGMVLDELARVKKNLDVDLRDVVYVEDLDKNLTPEQITGLWEVWAGTLSWFGSSLVGDGLATCSLLFDADTAERSRSIILATDNEVLGDAVYRLDQAAALAQRRGASVYGLFPQQMQGGREDREFARVLGSVGGKVWYAHDPAAVRTIVAEVVADQREVVARDAPPQVTDIQAAWTGLGATGLVLLLAARVWGRR